MSGENQNDVALVGFEHLPRCAHVRVKVVSKLLGVSVPSVWRYARLNLIPAPKTIGPNATGWNVGEIRDYLERLSDHRAA